MKSNLLPIFLVSVLYSCSASPQIIIKKSETSSVTSPTSTEYINTPVFTVNPTPTNTSTPGKNSSASAIDKTNESEVQAKLSSVMANMHSLQTTVETYAVDYGGVYPTNLSVLISEATTPGKIYWKEFKNPFTNATGLNGSCTDISVYSSNINKLNFKGMAIYESISTKTIYGTYPGSYKIWGADENGNLIQDKGQTFYLTNQ